MNKSNQKNKNTPPQISIVVPCFNEEEVIPETNKRLLSLMESLCAQGVISNTSAVFYVDDGSHDGTWEKIEQFSLENKMAAGIKLSANRGHQNALLCGLTNAPGDAIISVDADLQDDLEVIKKMIEDFSNGIDIVYGVRRKRSKDTFLKRFTAESYYRLMSFMGVDLLFNHADYRLLSRRAIYALSEYKEINLFLRGLVRLIGFNASVVEYDRAERHAGYSKYDIKRMISLAWQGITSFSIFPLRIITALGFFISLGSIFLTIWGIATLIIGRNSVPGWASTVLPMYFLGGVQLLCLGIIGEYIGKIYMETKQRPLFHINKIIGSAFEENYLLEK